MKYVGNLSTLSKDVIRDMINGEVRRLVIRRNSSVRLDPTVTKQSGLFTSYDLKTKASSSSSQGTYTLLASRNPINITPSLHIVHVGSFASSKRTKDSTSSIIQRSIHRRRLRQKTAQVGRSQQQIGHKIIHQD